MRGRAGDDLDDPAFLQFPKGGHEIAPPTLVPVVVAPGQAIEIELGELVELPLLARAFDFPPGQGDRAASR